MKYATTYIQHRSNIMEQFDEFHIIYDPADDTLPDFLEKYNEKTIIIHVNELTEKNIKLFKALSQKYGNIKLQIFYSEKDADTLVNEKIPFYFSNPVYSWDILNGFLKYVPTDVLIADELCFDIKRVASVAHSLGTAIRVIPNYCQSSFKGSPAMTQFFIRPEDAEIYEKYVDVFEIIGGLLQIKVFLRVYKEDRKWHGKLNEILIGFDSDIDNRGILPLFGDARLSCQKECARGASGCRTCFLCAKISETVKSTLDKT